jgi:hypothetical protein
MSYFASTTLNFFLPTNVTQMASRGIATFIAFAWNYALNKRITFWIF